MWKGLFPRVLAEKLDPVEALQFYTGTYLERDVRDLVRVRDFARFSNFLRLVAGRTGQLLNASTLAADAGISVKTAFEWLSVLEAGYVIRRLQPWFANISKRLSKTPKVYFLDTGLVCSLLGITSPEQLRTHPLRGAIFETLVVTEYWKRQCNTGRGELFHYRDGKQREIDLVRVCDGRTELVEIKSGQTPVSDWHETMDALAGQFGEGTARKVVYGGNMAQMRSDVEYLPWKSL